MTPKPVNEAQQSPVALVRRMTDISDADGLRALAERFEEFCRPDLEWRPRMVGFGKDAYIGKEGFGQYVDDMETTLEEFDLKIAEIRAVGDDHALLVGRLSMVGKGSGVPLDLEWAILYGFEDGLLRTGVAFNDHAEADAAAARIESELAK